MAVNSTTDLKQFFKWNIGTHARDSQWKWAAFHYQLKLVTWSFLFLHHIQAASVKHLKPHYLFFITKGDGSLNFWCFLKLVFVLPASVVYIIRKCTCIMYMCNFVIAERIYTVWVKLIFFFNSNFQLSGQYRTVPRYICLH